MTTQSAHQIDARPAEHRRLDERQRTFLFFLAVVAIAAVVRWLFLFGPVGSDDTRYMDAAVALANGEPPPQLEYANHHARASFLVWLASWSWLGLSASQLVFTQIVASAMQAGALLWVARMHTGEWSAFIAAALWVFFPVELVYGGMLSPDQLSLALALISMGFLIRGLRDRTTPHLRDGLLAGLAGGLAYSAKEPFFLLAIVWGAWSVYQIGLGRRTWRWHASLVAGFLIVIVLEHVFYAAWTGDWLYKYNVLLGAYGPEGRPRPSTSLSVLTYYLRQVLASFETSGFFGWLLLVGALASTTKVRNWGLILAWSIAFFVFLQFGSMSIQKYSHVPMQPRYVGPIVVLLFIPLGLTVFRLATESPLRWMGTLVLLFAFVYHGNTVGRERMALGLYNSDLPASAAALLDAPAIQRQNVLVPMNFRRYLPGDIRSATTHWQEIRFRDAALAEPSLLDESCRCVILIPARRSTGELRQLLENAGLKARPLEVPITPLDAMLDRAPFRSMNARALKRMVAHAYVHSPSPPAGLAP